MFRFKHNVMSFGVMVQLRLLKIKCRMQILYLSV